MESAPNFQYVNEAPRDVICSICLKPWWEPVETPCEHIYCADCIATALKKNAACPECRAPIATAAADLKRVTRLLRQQVDRLDVKCLHTARGCTWVGPREDYFTQHEPACNFLPSDAGETSGAADGPMASMTVAEYDQYHYATEVKAFAMLHLDAPTLPEEVLDAARKPLHICAVLDRSGSMGGDKIALVINTMEFVIQEMSARDTLTIVAYSSTAQVIFPEACMDSIGKAGALAVVRSLSAGGGTALSDGLFAGLGTFGFAAPSGCITAASQRPRPTQVCKASAPTRPTSSMMSRVRQLFTSSNDNETKHDDAVSRDPVSVHTAPKFVDDDTRSVWLLTDGEATTGIVDSVPMAAALRQTLGTNKSVSVYTFGFGTPHNQQLLSSIAETAGGMYYFVKDVDTIKQCFADCLGGLMSIVVRDIQISAQAVPGSNVRIVRVVGEDASAIAANGQRCAVTIRDMCSEENRDVVVEIALPAVPKADATARAVLTWKMTYRSCVGTEATWSVAKKLRISRPDIAPDAPAPVPNAKVQEQRARTVVLDALESAEKLASAGQYAQACEEITRSKAYSSAVCSKATAQGLGNRCDKLMSKCNESDWQTEGKYAVRSMAREQCMQRNCTVEPEQQMYTNAKRRQMQSKSMGS